MNKWEDGDRWFVLWLGPRDEKGKAALDGALCPYGGWCNCGADGPGHNDCDGWRCPQVRVKYAPPPRGGINAAREWAHENLRGADMVAIAGEIHWQALAAIQYYSVWTQKPIPVYYLAPGERWERIA